MAQYQITVDQELLHRLFLGNNKDAGVSALLESVLNQILQAQATEQLQAEPYERTDKRKGYRNGTRPHTLTTRVGTIALHVPRFRNGQFSTEMFARYQRSEQALILALMEMVINGGLYPQGQSDNGRAVWYRIFQIHCFRVVQETGPHCERLE
jgi:putative transposase